MRIVSVVLPRSRPSFARRAYTTSMVPTHRPDCRSIGTSDGSMVSVTRREDLTGVSTMSRRGARQRVVTLAIVTLQPGAVHLDADRMELRIERGGACIEP